ncbi:hypothetical protein I2492_13370 [Budviciaceae bacterium CWB-B4]|uniref:Uncharacterized protein n=1 Tax=Limnobaculum xujianqingii TaxID=2738837 RepID=A0A9D7AJX1_9GAMM|nr:hypothetical protein [Limnobaculum xujianqingii]MBK5073797.1 hypothetical protein [Limnobaculum xujianqingii]MBK5177309.1 hypothetical protein [Limnobaculum xujianqingii]
MIAIVASGDPALLAHLMDKQRAAYEELRGNKGTTTTLPIPELDPNGGKLVNPITDQQGGTALVNPDKW